MAFPNASAAAKGFEQETIDEASDPLSSEPSYGGELDEDFRAAAIEAFPDMAEDDVRLSALKTLVELCMEAKGSGGSEKSGPAPKGGSADLALVFGKGGK